MLDGRGSPISARDIAAIRMRASLVPSPEGGTSGFAYDGAVPRNQEMLAWQPWIRSPDSEINFDRDRMVARARDLVRNDGWAKGAINRFLDAAIGSSFFPVPQPNWEALSRWTGLKFDAAWAKEFKSAIKAEWKLFANSRTCDATETQNFAQMMRSNMRHKVLDGDGLVMPIWDPDADFGAYATRFLVVNPDRLSNRNQMIDTHAWRGGVHINDRGGPIGYAIRRAHQYDPYDNMMAFTWDEFDRQTAWGRPIVVHDFDRDSAGQHRGTGILAEVLGRFRMLNKFDASSLQAAVLRCVMGFFITSSQNSADVGDALEAQAGAGAGNEEFFQNLASALYQQQPVTVGGMRIPVLAPNDKIQTVQGGSHVDDYKEFHSSAIRLIAAGTGQADQEVSGDFRDVNYSSYRGAMAQSWKNSIRRRTDYAVNTATPLYGCFVEEFCGRFPGALPNGADLDPKSSGYLFGDLRTAVIDCRWIGPGRGWIDPVKERQGEVLGLDAGFGTLEDSCADIEGEDWEDRVTQRAAEVAKFHELGLRLPQVYTGAEPAQDEDRKPQPV